MGAIGFDVGTFNLVCARRGEGDEVKYRKEINSFIELPLENKYLFNMMKKAGVPLIEMPDVAYVVGEAAVNMAYTLKQIALKRPMKDGCLNAQEQDAYKILSIMIHSLVGKVDNDKEVLYYCVPANAVNLETDADYHEKVVNSMFKAYNVDKKTLQAYPINEALALVYAELGQKQYTGIGISFGAGMVNFCYAIYASSVCEFSSVNCGDWIDQQAAKATNESVTVVNKAKTKIDLSKPPTSAIERAIQTQYRLMVEKTVANIKKAIVETDSVKSENPVDIVIAGGSSAPNGFVELVREVIKEAKLPIEIGEIRRPDDHLYAVARGCLIAAEVSQQ
jgi:actin-like ATPase involved in cell morphogenesis